MFACSKNSRELNNTIEISIHIYMLFGLQNMMFSPQLSQNVHIVLICEKNHINLAVYILQLVYNSSSSTSSESKQKTLKTFKKIKEKKEKYKRHNP